MTEEAIKAANGELDWFGTYVKFVEDGIFFFYDFLSSVGVERPYGYCILTFLILVKIVTFPLNWSQYSSTAEMTAIRPQQALVNKWYGDNKEITNAKTAGLFQKFEVNPLGGCLPSLLQLPVFLGVYYSVTSIAKASVFDEGFLWLPSLSGPIADRKEGMSWLTENWIDGVPRLGWEDTLAYLTIPAILVCSQTLALQLLGSYKALEQTEGQSGSAASATASTGLILRALPWMLGWFAMNAPAGLGVYWIFNNIFTTISTVTIKKLTEKEPFDFEVDVNSLGPRRPSGDKAK